MHTYVSDSHHSQPQREVCFPNHQLPRKAWIKLVLIAEGVRVVRANPPVNHVILDGSLGDFPSNQPLESENGIPGVDNRLSLPGSPTKRSPCFVKPTTEGVVRAPSAFSMTRVNPMVKKLLDVADGK